MPNKAYDMKTSYISVDGLNANSITVKKSEFIAHAKHISNSEEALKFIDEIKSTHKTARHNVYAYFISETAERFSDDGEPKGTAGNPVLEAIKRSDLDNVCVVVTRYFGGILLGASGLLRAYSKAASEVLSKSRKAQYKLCREFTVEVDYKNLKTLQNIVDTNGGQILTRKFSEGAEFTLAIPEEISENAKRDLESVSNLKNLKAEETYYKFS